MIRCLLVGDLERDRMIGGVCVRRRHPRRGWQQRRERRRRSERMQDILVVDGGFEFAGVVCASV